MSRFVHDVAIMGMLGAAMMCGPGAQSQEAGVPARAIALFEKQLPALQDAHLTITLLEVRYGPGESSQPHTHSCPVLVYVLEGAVRTRIGADPETIYHAGQTFYEAPNGVHQVSANASQTEPAKMLAYFVCDHEGPLSSDPPQR